MVSKSNGIKNMEEIEYQTREECEFLCQFDGSSLKEDSKKFPAAGKWSENKLTVSPVYDGKNVENKY